MNAMAPTTPPTPNRDERHAGTGRGIHALDDPIAGRSRANPDARTVDATCGAQ